VALSSSQKDLGVEEQIRLNCLFEMPPSLQECYNLRESLFDIFELEISKEQAEEKIDEWIKSTELYTTKGHNPFTSFIKTYKNYKPNILNYFSHRATSGPVEGLNNKLKVIKRRGYGFRNIMNFCKTDISRYKSQTYLHAHILKWSQQANISENYSPINLKL